MITPVASANVEIIRAMWDAYERHGLPAILDFAAPDAEWVPYSASGKRFANTAEYRRYIARMDERHEVVEATLAEVREVGESIVVSGRLRLRTPEGITDTAMFWVHRFRDGKIAYTASYPSRQEAMEDA